MAKRRLAKLALSAVGIAALLGTTAATVADEGKYGGTMRVVGETTSGSVDPQINYTLQYWQIAYLMYDGLVTFKKAPGAASLEVIPDLAEAMPAVEDGGKRYVFTLRKGIKFSDGRDVTVKDVVASFQRLYKVGSPTAGTQFNWIVGAEACLKTPATCTLDGGVVGDEAGNKITINLTQPDADFLQKLAIPFASVVPADAPSKDTGTVPVIGTGAYMIESYDPSTRLRMVRNPHFAEWSADAQPKGYPDAINYDFGLSEQAEVTAVENGQADWMLGEDGLPPDRLPEVSAKYADQIHLDPELAFRFVFMNNNLSPFDDVRVRRAVSMALDRNALVKLYGGPAIGKPSCQILPPMMPSYEAYCPFTVNPGAQWTAPDLKTAKALIAESGKAGEAVNIVVEDTNNSRAVGVYLQSVLKELGFKGTVTPISREIQWVYIQNTKNKVQMGVSVWFADYPAASNFIVGKFDCASFLPGSDVSPNFPGYCHKDVDEMMAKAAALQVTDPAAGAKMWTQIDHRITDDAAYAVYLNPSRIDFFSKRVKNVVYSPLMGWIMSKSWLEE